MIGRARYFEDPYFPDCFVCGTNREPGDGLRSSPAQSSTGHVGGAMDTGPTRPAAERWSGESGSGSAVRPGVVWAALDCPSGIAAGEVPTSVRTPLSCSGR